MTCAHCGHTRYSRRFPVYGYRSLRDVINAEHECSECGHRRLVLYVPAAMLSKDDDIARAKGRLS